MQIVPHDGSPDAASSSPYIAYECLVWNERFVVVSNGTHTRPIFERLKAGNSPRDAILAVLVGLDREFDDYDTPRICGLLDAAEDRLWLGSVTKNSLSVMPIEIEPGQMAYITTYEFPLPSAGQVDRLFRSETVSSACEHIIRGSIFAEFERPVCAAAALFSEGKVEVGTSNSDH